MLFATTLISIASVCFAKEVIKNRKNEPDAIIDQFAWLSLSDETGIDPLKYLKAPAEDVPETLACTTKPGPDRVACPAAIAEWFNLIDEQRHINLACRPLLLGSINLRLLLASASLSRHEGVITNTFVVASFCSVLSQGASLGPTPICVLVWHLRVRAESITKPKRKKCEG